MKTGFHQGSLLNPVLLASLWLKIWLPLDKRLVTTRQGSSLPCFRHDLDFADDLVLLIQKITCVQQKIDALQQQTVRVGLKVNASKIKEMRFQSPTTTGDNICGEEERLWSTLVTAFKYLGSPV